MVSVDQVEQLEAGDRVAEWLLKDRDGSLISSGPIESPADLALCRVEQGPRGSLFLVIDDGTVSGEWGRRASVVVRPELDGDELSLYKELSSGAEVSKGDLLSRLGEHLERAERPIDAAWAFAESGAAAEDLAGNFLRARKLARQKRAYVGELFRREAKALRNRGAETDTRRRELIGLALDLDRDLDPTGPAVATDLEQLALLDMYGSNPAVAEELLLEALQLRRAIEPDSLYSAETISRLILTLAQLGRFECMLERNRQLYELLVRIDAAPIERVRVHSVWGQTLSKLGRLQEAREQLEAAAELVESTPLIEPSVVAIVAGGLASLYYDFGDFVSADRYIRQAVEIAETLDSQLHLLPIFLNTLATIQSERLEFAAADTTFARVIALYEERSPSSSGLAIALNNRAVGARASGDLDRALALAQRAQAMAFDIAPESLNAANSRVILAHILAKRGDVEGAVRETSAALDSVREQFAESPRVARTVALLGTYQRDLGNLDAARELFTEAIETYRGRSPGVADHARALHGLGLVAAEQDRQSEATENLCAAVDVIDQQRIGMGTDRRSSAGFAREFSDFYHHCSEALLAADRTAEAFAIVERSRARDLLILLAQRHPSLDARVPEALRLGRSRLNASYDALYERLGGPKGSSPDQVETQRELEVLRQERLDLERALRTQDSRLAAVQFPVPLDFDAAVAALEPGTVALTYSLGEASSRLFVVGRSVGEQRIATFAIDLERDRLEALVAGLRQAIIEQSEYRFAARRLWDALLAPAEPWLGDAERLLISADGALNNLPFGALVDADGRFLVERLPLHAVASVTVRQELRRRAKAKSRAVTRGSLVIFGDPVVDEGQRSFRVRSAVRSGFDLSALPESRREAEAIAGLFEGSAVSFLGSAATESRFKEVAANVDRLHIATHGYVDDTSPLDSGLVFSHQDGDGEGTNGILQAWEIFDQLELNADLW